MCEPETIMRASPSPSTPPFKFNSTTPEISTLSPTLVKRMQGDTCYICNQQGHWSWYCPLNSPNNKPLSPSPNPNSTPPSQLNPSTPEISSLSPNVVERMQREKCYRCNKQGHWSWYCPLNSPDNKPLSPSPSPNHKMIPCRCGHGFWEVKTSHSCPIKRLPDSSSKVSKKRKIVRDEKSQPASLNHEQELEETKSLNDPSKFEDCSDQPPPSKIAKSSKDISSISTQKSFEKDLPKQKSDNPTQVEILNSNPSSHLKASFENSPMVEELERQTHSPTNDSPLEVFRTLLELEGLEQNIELSPDMSPNPQPHPIQVKQEKLKEQALKSSNESSPPKQVDLLKGSSNKSIHEYSLMDLDKCLQVLDDNPFVVLDMLSSDLSFTSVQSETIVHKEQLEGSIEKVLKDFRKLIFAYPLMKLLPKDPKFQDITKFLKIFVTRHRELSEEQDRGLDYFIKFYNQFIDVLKQQEVAEFELSQFTLEKNDLCDKLKDSKTKVTKFDEVINYNDHKLRDIKNKQKEIHDQIQKLKEEEENLQKDKSFCESTNSKQKKKKDEMIHSAKVISIEVVRVAKKLFELEKERKILNSRYEGLEKHFDQMRSNPPF